MDSTGSVGLDGSCAVARLASCSGARCRASLTHPALRGALCGDAANAVARAARGARAARRRSRAGAIHSKSVANASARRRARGAAGPAGASGRARTSDHAGPAQSVPKPRNPRCAGGRRSRRTLAASAPAHRRRAVARRTAAELSRGAPPPKVRAGRVGCPRRRRVSPGIARPGGSRLHPMAEATTILGRGAPRSGPAPIAAVRAHRMTKGAASSGRRRVAAPSGLIA